MLYDDVAGAVVVVTVVVVTVAVADSVVGGVVEFVVVVVVCAFFEPNKFLKKFLKAVNGPGFCAVAAAAVAGDD